MVSGHWSAVFTADRLVDAVPKKRGPKTDVLEALLKRVDGLERRLKEEKKSNASRSPEGVTETGSKDAVLAVEEPDSQQPQHDKFNATAEETAVYTPSSAR